MNPATDATRIAIECLTLWLEPGQESREQAALHITQVLESEGAAHVIGGHLNLAMLLLFDLVKAQGAEGTGDYFSAAHEHLRRLSPELPD